MAHDVVIAGGGFGGLYAARRLERRLPRHGARIVLVSDVNFLLQGRRTRPFRYRTLGVFVDMGQHKAVATMLGVRLRGFPAGRKIRLGLEWAVGLPFGRAAAELGQLGHPDPLERHLEESSAP